MDVCKQLEDAENKVNASLAALAQQQIVLQEAVNENNNAQTVANEALQVIAEAKVLLGC